eukprot:TRINITY_DN27182_c0_g1_i1.p1 TRINITY_DN27182_c0_g1~~TRINITY_DN27182_c0_g1_i1.p1  ORF type:complete len:427 (+),score=137.99 TRINITY_DN27182_c0_g1_i1:123-1403(+)
MSIPTVSGAAPAGGWSWALAGEFLFFDLTDERRDEVACGPLDLPRLHALRAAPRTRAENMRCTAADAPLVAADLEELRAAAPPGGVLVDLSTEDMGGNRAEAARLAASVGVAVVASTGYHLQPPMSAPREGREDYTAALRRDLGVPKDAYAPVPTTPPPCGAISCSPHTTMTPASTALLAQCAQVSAETKAPVHVALPHGFDPEAVGPLVEGMRAAGPPAAVVLCNCLPVAVAGEGAHAGAVAAAWGRLLAGAPELFLSFEYFGWGGLVVDGVHPFGHEVPSRSHALAVARALHAAHPGKILHSTLHCTKHCSTAWGGPGRAAAVRAAGGGGLPPRASDAYLAALAWWAPPKPTAAPKVYWLCSFCSGENVEAVPDASFRKGGRRYCSMYCLKKENPPAAEPERERRGGGRAGGDGMGSWGVAMTE